MTNPQLLKDLGKRISTQRKALDLTQGQVAEKMDVSVQMISNLKLGHKAIRPENLAKISTILHISTDYLLFGRGSRGEISGIASKFNRCPQSSKPPWGRSLTSFLIQIHRKVLPRLTLFLRGNTFLRFGKIMVRSPHSSEHSSYR